MMPDMADDEVRQGPQIPSGAGDYLVATAALAPSVQNTQPWRFRVGRYSVELLSDPRRKLRVDPAGREMLLSCGAALFGLRLGVRSLGFVPVVDLDPDESRPQVLARVSLGAAEPMTEAEHQLLAALPRRHTHRGAFAAGALPAELVADMQHDAAAEGATLALVDRSRGYEQLADLVTAASLGQYSDPAAMADIQEWTRGPADPGRDGVPSAAFASQADPRRGRLEQRDFDLGRGLGQLDETGPAPAVTAVLLTPGDDRGDWMCAGQGLHRILARAAGRWIFASLHTQPLENPAIRDLIADRLGLAGAPQMILQFGPARTAQATARRSPSELIDP